MKIISFDMETGEAEDIHRTGRSFLRLAGWKTVGSGEPAVVTTDMEELVGALDAADAVTGANIANFDLLGLAKYYGADYESLCRKSWDSLVVEQHLDPVAAQGAQANGYYRLDATAKRYGVRGKAEVDFEGKREIVRRVKGDKAASRLKPPSETRSYPVLKLLKGLYGGYDRIPQDDPDYIKYLRMDVDASEGVFLAQHRLVSALTADSKKYLRREHAVSAAMGRITLEGSRIDVDLTLSRHAEGQARLESSARVMHEVYGMPLEGRYPHRSNLGKAAFRAALIGSGISDAALSANWPVGGDGALLTNKDVLGSMIEVFDTRNPEAAQLCRTVLAMNGERTVYGTFADALVDGRVHPYIGADQSSGRWSLKRPGFTVMGKRGGKARERALVLADSDDEVLVAIDADQIDARMVAVMSQDPEYMKLFEPGRDLHSEVALRVFNRPECRAEMARNGGRCDCEWREKAKGCSHSWNYGATPNTLLNNFGIPLDVGHAFDAGMREAFPVLCTWQDEMRALAGVVPYGEEVPADDPYRILHTVFGRPVRVERRRAYTQACAQLGQGATRDAMAEAVLGLPADIRRRIRAVIHDEIVLSIRKAGAQEEAQRIADSMAFTLRGVRISFGVSRVGDCWAACYGAQYCPHGDSAVPAS